MEHGRCAQYAAHEITNAHRTDSKVVSRSPLQPPHESKRDMGSVTHMRAMHNAMLPEIASHNNCVAVDAGLWRWPANINTD